MRIFLIAALQMVCLAASAWSATAAAAAGEAETPALPEGFVHVADVVPDARLDPKYATSDNFTGAPVPGYLAPTVVMTREAALALARAAEEARADGLVFVVYDGYRPQQASNRFIRWTAEPDDPARRAVHYPAVAAKTDLFRLGYLSPKSGHSRGAAVDLTLARADTGELLDMGGFFDFFDGSSWHGAPGLTPEARNNRSRLRTLMERHGFQAYEKEWWHYRLTDEPHPNRYFNFPVR